MSENEKYWANCGATGKAVVPVVTCGWDNRPRWTTGTNGAVPCGWYTAATPSEITHYILDARRWIDADAARSPARTMLIYAWNESDEGGWLVPTLEAGPARLNAVRAAADAMQIMKK